jgi:NitT/TauT family transport system permease protein
VTGGESRLPAAPVARRRIAVVVVALLVWQGVAASGILFRDVVPTLDQIALALVRLMADRELYGNLGVSGYEIAAALAIGGTAGLAVGLLLGSHGLLGRTFEPYLHYLGPTPKIIFFPVMIMWFGVDRGSKIAMGAVSGFFPMALSAAVGMRQIDPVLVRVGRSFRASTAQMVTAIYLHALRAPLLTGLRLALGVSVIGVLLAETKLSDRGLGYLVMQRYASFDLAGLYALLIVIMLLSTLANALFARLGKPRRATP